MNLTIPDYAEGDRIPRGDWGARIKHGKAESNAICMVVGCDKSSVECEEHDRFKVTAANDAWDRARDKALAYCWGRADAGDATAHPQEVWRAFSERYARANFEFTLETRTHMHSIQRAWELFINDEEI